MFLTTTIVDKLFSGMSIGSIASGKTVSGVTFSGNTVTDSMYGTRIKVDADATSGSVSDVTYSGYEINLWK